MKLKTRPIVLPLPIVKCPNSSCKYRLKLVSGTGYKNAESDVEYCCERCFEDVIKKQGDI